MKLVLLHVGDLSKFFTIARGCVVILQALYNIQYQQAAIVTHSETLTMLHPIIHNCVNQLPGVTHVCRAIQLLGGHLVFLRN